MYYLPNLNIPSDKISNSSQQLQHNDEICTVAGVGKVDGNLKRRQPTNFKNALLNHSSAMTD
jgi:hypothetical protein